MHRFMFIFSVIVLMFYCDSTFGQERSSRIVEFPFTEFPVVRPLRLGLSEQVNMNSGIGEEVFTFKHSRQFMTVPETSHACEASLSGVIIYEGMTIEIDDHGHYRIRFIVQAPRTVVTLTLQFCASESADRATSQPQITIPPIVLEPPKELPKQQLFSIYSVTFSGYSKSLSTSERGTRGLYRHGAAIVGGLPGSNHSYFSAEN